MFCLGSNTENSRVGPELRSPGTLSCPNQHGSPVDTDGEGGYAGVLKALEGQGQSANASESATRYHRLQRVQGDESSPQSWRNFQKPYLFCPWTVLLWADSELTGGGGGPTVSCAWCSEPAQGAGRWVDEKGRLPGDSDHTCLPCCQGSKTTIQGEE